MSRTKFTAIIVLYKNKVETINKNLKSLTNIYSRLGEVILISNGGNYNYGNVDTKIKKKLKIIINKKNVGFAKAVNQGIVKSKNRILLVLNPDTEIIDSSPLLLYEEIMRNSKIGIIGGKMIRPNGTEYLSANGKPNFLTGIFEFSILKRIFTNNIWSRNFWLEKKEKTTRPIKATSVCGGYMFIRKHLKNKLNLLDEKYFLYLEDMEYGLNNINNGFEVWFDPRSTIIHIGGESSRENNNIRLDEWYKSRRIYFSRHLQSKIENKLINMFFTFEENILYLLSLCKK